MSTALSLAGVTGGRFLLAWMLVVWGQLVSAQAVVTEVGSSSCSAEALSTSSPNEDYEQHEGAKIASIRFMQVGVFDLTDPDENNALYAFFNRLHINTRSSTVRPQLLFAVGDLVNSKVIAETERLLRALPYLGNAQISVDEVCGDEVALLVKTRDVWTTEPSVSLGREGGETKHGFGLSEGNILGTGNSVSIDYDKTQDRSSISYGFHSPHLFNTRLTSDIGFVETSDGQETYFALQHPFYSLHTPWAAGVISRDITTRQTIRYRDEVIDEYRHGNEYLEFYTGHTFADDRSEARRIVIGLSQERDVYESLPESNSPPPLNENVVYPWLEYQLLENRFAVYENLNQMHRVEDISMGADFRVRLGYAGKMYNNDHDAWRYTLTYGDLLGVGEHHLVKYRMSLDGRNYTGQPDLSHAVWGGELGYHFLMGSRHRIYASLRYHQGRNLPVHRELTAGGEQGLRGYPLDYQRGDKRYLFSLEKRYITDWHILNLFRMGAVMYVDLGRAWGAGYPRATHLSNVGVGLRASSSKAKIGTILHLDFAFPLADKQYVDEFQLVMRASKSL